MSACSSPACRPSPSALAVLLRLLAVLMRVPDCTCLNCLTTPQSSDTWALPCLLATMAGKTFSQVACQLPAGRACSMASDNSSMSSTKSLSHLCVMKRFSRMVVKSSFSPTCPTPLTVLCMETMPFEISHEYLGNDDGNGGFDTQPCNCSLHFLNANPMRPLSSKSGLTLSTSFSTLQVHNKRWNSNVTVETLPSFLLYLLSSHTASASPQCLSFNIGNLCCNILLAVCAHLASLCGLGLLQLAVCHHAIRVQYTLLKSVWDLGPHMKSHLHTGMAGHNGVSGQEIQWGTTF